jgi:hypothetical protein
MDKRLAHFGAIAQPSTSEPCSLASFFVPFYKPFNKRVAAIFNPTPSHRPTSTSQIRFTHWLGTPSPLA